MRVKIFVITALCFAVTAFSQVKYIHGNKFEFNASDEKDVKLLAGDKDSYFMQSRINENSIRNNNTILVRKFDNLNKLKETFSHSMPQMEKYAPIEYLGSFDSGNKIVFITETYSGKSKKKDIYKITFDKSSSTFTDEILATYPIESMMKSGTSYFEKSENGRYAAVVFYAHSPRKEPVKIDVNLIETGSTQSVWKKQVTAEAGSSDTDFFVTNSGNVGLLRTVQQNAMLLYVTATAQEEKFFTEKMKIISETAVSIGPKDYLVAFTSNPKTIKMNAANFESLMLYDIQEGKVIANEVASAFNDGSKITDVFIPYTYSNGENIYLFTESKLNAGTRQVKSPMGTMMISETLFLAGDPRLTVVNVNTGKIVTTNKIATNSASPAELEFHSMGLINIKGNYVYKNGKKYDFNSVNLDSYNFGTLKNMPPYDGNIAEISQSGNSYNQALLYRPDSQSIYFPRTFDGSNTTASIVSIQNFDGK